jgi:xanthine dehydrogenase accessory factor
VFKASKPADFAVVIKVNHAQGSVPRDNGTWMVVYGSRTAQSIADTEGTIGGGHLEYVAIAKAHRLIDQVVSFVASASATPQNSMLRISERYALGPSLGQCCGGVLELDYQVIFASDVPQFRRVLASTPERFHLQLYGAGHVGQAIVRALLPIACSVNWIDERETFLQYPQMVESPTTVNQKLKLTKVCVDSPAAEVAHAPSGSAFLVLTHSHALDLDVVTQVLKRNDFSYLGLIGSKTKRARFEHQLKSREFSESVIQKMVCPIGLNAIVGKEPEIIAASVVAQLLQTFPPPS